MSDRSLQAATRPALVVLMCAGFGVAQAAAQAPAVTPTWVDQIGEVGPYEQATAVAVAGGSVYVSGPTGGLGPAYLRRYSDAGSLLWELSLATGTASPPVLFADETRLCAGGTTKFELDPPYAPILGQSAGFIRCLDPDGHLLVDEQILAAAPLFPPWTYVQAIAAGPKSLYVVGRTTGAVSDCEPACSYAGLEDSFIRKYSFDGVNLTPEWTRQYGTAANDYFLGLSVDASGERVRVWGTEQVTLSGGPPWSANTLLLRCYNDDGSDCGADRLAFGADSPHSGAFAGDAFYLASSVADPSAEWGFATVLQRFALLDGIAIEQEDWSDTLPNANVFETLIDGSGVVVAGQAQIPLPGQQGAGGQDAFARRYDATGTASWTVQLGTHSSDTAFAAGLDADAVFLGGYTSGVLVDGHPSSSDTDGFIARVERPDSPTNAIDGLIVRVRELVDDGTLRSGQGRSLLWKLRLALYMLDVGNARAAVNMLRLFVFQVRFYGNVGILESDVAAELITAAEGAIASISP